MWQWKTKKKGNENMRQRKNERGNVFMTLFAAVAVVGAIGAGSVSMLKGPVGTMVALNKSQMAEMKMEIAAKLVMAQVVASPLVADGDGGTDYIEPTVYAAGTITGGGIIPTTLGINDFDPWGARFGYCVWDNGTVSNGKNDAGVGTDNRLTGDNNPSTEVIVMVSSGPNRQFETGCYAYGDAAPEGVVKPSGSDDIVVSYTYTEALATMGDFWKFRGDTDPTATESVLAIDENLDLKADVTVSGKLQFNVQDAGLVLSDSPGATCNAQQEDQLFLDTSASPPSIVICEGGIISSIVAGGGGSTSNPLESCPNVGDECSDGTIYAGVSPDGSVNMFTTHCDIGQTWNGVTCSGSVSNQRWSNSNAAYSDYQVTSATSDTDGDGNTATIITVDADGTVAGFQTHQAAQTCSDLSYGGNTDWYLPSVDELNVLYGARNVIGNFQNDDYWTSTESVVHASKSIDFDGGTVSNFNTKNTGENVRCVRNGEVGTGGSTFVADTTTGLIAHWPLDETSGSDIADRTDNWW